MGEREEFRRQVHGSRAADELDRLADGAAERIDALGTFCPEPLIRTQEAARGMSGGQILLLIADDAGVEVDIPAWCMSHGHEYLGTLREERRLRVLVRLRS